MRNVDFKLLINRKSQPTKNNNPTNKKNKTKQNKSFEMNWFPV